MLTPLNPTQVAGMTPKNPAYMQKSVRFLGLVSPKTAYGLFLAFLTACAAPTGVDRAGFIPAGGEPDPAVLDPRMGVTYTPTPEGWLKCAYRYDGVSVCWLVADTVSGGPR